ncbi:MAG: AbrB/MazE/SpoVT family DNA-binding domain-containing protein [Thermofilaceae archaeon]
MGYEVETGGSPLPYESKVYINNQVLIPASIVKALNLRDVKRARITLEHMGLEVIVEVKLLRTRHTDSRQFTIPKSARDRYGISPGSMVKIKSIEPLD